MRTRVVILKRGVLVLFLVNMSSSGGSESDVEQQDIDDSEPVPVEHLSEDEGEGPSDQLMEPAPPTYQEALNLRLFTRDPASSGASGNGGGAVGTASRQDSQLAEELQLEEIQQRVARERSVSLTVPPSERSMVRTSVSSAPGDFRPMARNPTYALQHRQRLRTIPEDEELTIIPASHCPELQSCSCNTCLYYSCFGFTIFTDRLSPALRGAWKSGAKLATNITLPVFSLQSRYIIFATQALITAACMILSFASTPLKNENLVRTVSLTACLIVNVLERVISWCGCCQSKQKMYNSVSDVTRNLLTDIFLYPAVVASIMNTLNTRSYNTVLSIWDDSVYANVSNADEVIEEDAINISLNATVLLLFIIMVHGLRLGQLGKIVASLLGKLKGDVSGARSTARVFIIGFFVHVLIWSVVQLLYLLLIGFRLQTEMTESSQPQVLGVSVHLITMMICGELVPLLGIFMYFITAQKWVEEFPIALHLNHAAFTQSPSGAAFDRIKYQFKTLHTTNTKCSGCLFGLIHPFMSPFQLLITMVFFILWLLFVCTFPVSSTDSTYLDLSFGNTSSSLRNTVVMAVAYGLIVVLSLLVSLLPLVYGLLGLAMLPFWFFFYMFVACISFCSTKS